MADTAIPITAGSGTNVDTRTEATNGNHRQVVVVGDPSTNAGVAPVDATSGLKVDLGTDNDVTVTGSVTANAGTNLNTSALALESGGNLAAAATSLAALDNSVDGNYLNTNMNISGTDVDSNSGNKSAATQRVVLATDDVNSSAIKTAVEVMDDWDESDRAKVNPIAGQAGVAAGAGAVGATTQRVVQANDAGKTILSAGGSASSSGNNTLVAAGSAKLKVKAFSLTTTSTTAVTCIFQSGAGGTELWRVVLQAPSGASTGANLSVNAPDYIFATASATLLNLNLSSANAVHWSVSYFDEA